MQPVLRFCFLHFHMQTHWVWYLWESTLHRSVVRARVVYLSPYRSGSGLGLVTRWIMDCVRTGYSELNIRNSNETRICITIPVFTQRDDLIRMNGE